MNWPWTTWKSIIKELENRNKEAKENPESLVRYDNVADLFSSLGEYKPTIWDKFRWWLNDAVWEVHAFFKPAHQQIRKAIPNRWCDITELLRIVNFEFLKSYHDNEMHIIDWDADPTHKEFKEWINGAYQYITVDRPALDKELYAAYPPLDAKGTYEEKYGEVNRLEQQIEERDTEILVEIMKRRRMFWS